MPTNTNRERGLKAALNNPRVSEQAKQRDREILSSEYGETAADPGYMPTTGGGDESSSKMSKSKSTGMSAEQHSTTSSYSAGMGMKSGSGSGRHVRGEGMRTSAPPERRAIMLPEDEEMEEMEGKDVGNVKRGLKAAISNKNVSEEAKERDRQKLRELGGE